MHQQGSRDITLVDPSWANPHPRYLKWFGLSLTQMELAAVVEAIAQGAAVPTVEVLPDGTVIRGWVVVAAHRVLKLDQLAVQIRDFDGDPMATEIVAEVLKDALQTLSLIHI